MAKIAVLLADDFEDAEFRVPYDRLKAKGHELTVLGISAGSEVNRWCRTADSSHRATPGTSRPSPRPS
jgi:protease I